MDRYQYLLLMAGCLTILLWRRRLDREQPQHPGAEHHHAGPDQGPRQRAAGLPDPEGATPAA